jgi:levanbiose-producing levanase
LPLDNGLLRLDIIVDRGSVEVFANGGRTVLTDVVFPPADADRVSVFAERGTATFSGLTVTPLGARDRAGEGDCVASAR